MTFVGGNVDLIDCIIDFQSTQTGTGNLIVLSLGGGSFTANIEDCRITLDSATTTLSQNIGITGSSSGFTINIRDTFIHAYTTDSGSAIALRAEGAGTFNLYNVILDANNSDADEEAIDVTAGDTVNAHNVSIVEGTITNNGTLTEWGIRDENQRPRNVAGMYIGTVQDNNLFDDTTTGGGTTTMYIGNGAINVTCFTQYHSYQLGDKDLETGEAVRLDNDGLLYRTTSENDPTFRGLFYKKTAWRTAFGDELIQKGYEKIDAEGKKRQKDKKKDYKYKTKKKATKNDYAYYVAVIGDSYVKETGESVFLDGAWVCDEGGSINNGDFLTTANRAGYLKKQTDNLHHTYTAGKMRQDIIFIDGINKTAYMDIY